MLKTYHTRDELLLTCLISDMGEANRCCWYDRLKLLRLRHSLADEDVQKLAAASHGYVGADISALCQQAAMCALRRHVAAQRLQQTVSEQPDQEAAAVSLSGTEHPARPEASVFQADAAKPPLQAREQLSRVNCESTFRLTFLTDGASGSFMRVSP